MKYIFLLLISFSIFAQEEVEFSFKYQTNTKAVIEMETELKTEMSYQGDISTLPENMRARLPLSMTGKEIKIQNLITGKLSEDGSFPVKIEVLKDRKYYSIDGSQLFENKSDKSSMEGVTINGKGMPNGDTVYVSSEGEKVTKELEAILKSAFNQVGEIKELVGEKVTVGESVSVGLPMSIPVGDDVINLNMDMEYKLNEVIDGIADFNVLYSADVEMECKSGPFRFKSSGQGEMTYDTTRSYTPVMNSIMTIDMSIPMGSGKLITKNIVSSKMTTTLLY